jgi:hypothetical protein
MATARCVILVPRWELEAWAEHLLRGTAVSEDRKAGWSTQRAQKEGHQAGGILPVHRPRGGELPTCCPPSLVMSDGELARLDE